MIRNTSTLSVNIPKSSFLPRPLPRQDIVERAILSTGQKGYNLVYANCEHFATDCRYGQSTSRQVR